MNAKQTALILIGYQNDYFSSDGALRSVIETDADAVLTHTLDMIASLRDTELTMITTPILFTDDYSELIDPIGILKAVKDAGAFRRGSHGGQTIDQIKAYGERIDEVPGKRGLNAFAETELEQILRGKGITDVVLAGVVTSICIDSTGRSAHEHGFHVHIVSDATCGRSTMEQEFYCENIFPLYADVIDHRALVEEIAGASI